MTISSLKQVVCLESLGTLWDYLDPLAVPQYIYEINRQLTFLGSSPGLNGFTYTIIKFLWPLIGHPVTKGFEVMVEKEELYPNLRTASIKLIPKKGDCSMIKNWRPISLLSNVY